MTFNFFATIFFALLAWATWKNHKFLFTVFSFLMFACMWAVVKNIFHVVGSIFFGGFHLGGSWIWSIALIISIGLYILGLFGVGKEAETLEKWSFGAMLLFGIVFILTLIF